MTMITSCVLSSIPEEDSLSNEEVDLRCYSLVLHPWRNGNRNQIRARDHASCASHTRSETEITGELNSCSSKFPSIVHRHWLKANFLPIEVL